MDEASSEAWPEDILKATAGCNEKVDKQLHLHGITATKCAKCHLRLQYTDTKGTTKCKNCDYESQHKAVCSMCGLKKRALWCHECDTHFCGDCSSKPHVLSLLGRQGPVHHCFATDDASGKMLAKSSWAKDFFQLAKETLKKRKEEQEKEKEKEKDTGNSATGQKPTQPHPKPTVTQTSSQSSRSATPSRSPVSIETPAILESRKKVQQAPSVNPTSVAPLLRQNKQSTAQQKTSNLSSTTQHTASPAPKQQPSVPSATSQSVSVPPSHKQQTQCTPARPQSTPVSSAPKPTAAMPPAFSQSTSAPSAPVATRKWMPGQPPPPGQPRPMHSSPRPWMPGPPTPRQFASPISAPSSSIPANPPPRQSAQTSSAPKQTATEPHVSKQSASAPSAPAQSKPTRSAPRESIPVNAASKQPTTTPSAPAVSKQSAPKPTVSKQQAALSTASKQSAKEPAVSKKSTVSPASKMQASIAPASTGSVSVPSAPKPTVSIPPTTQSTSSTAAQASTVDLKVKSTIPTQTTSPAVQHPDATSSSAATPSTPASITPAVASSTSTDFAFSKPATVDTSTPPPAVSTASPAVSSILSPTNTSSIFPSIDPTPLDAAPITPSTAVETLPKETGEGTRKRPHPASDSSNEIPASRQQAPAQWRQEAMGREVYEQILRQHEQRYAQQHADPPVSRPPPTRAPAPATSSALSVVDTDTTAIDFDEDPLASSVESNYDLLNDHIHKLEVQVTQMANAVRHYSAKQEFRRASRLNKDLQEHRQQLRQLQAKRIGAVAKVVIYSPNVLEQVRSLANPSADVPQILPTSHDRCWKLARIKTTVRTTLRECKDSLAKAVVSSDPVARANIVALGERINQQEQELQTTQQEWRREFVNMVQYSREVRVALKKEIREATDRSGESDHQEAVEVQ